MKITYQTKEESNQKRLEEFLSLSKNEQEKLLKTQNQFMRMFYNLGKINNQ